jgi:PHD/YefM family antitoxin component YafN of YafNO toxin-antitoxin module
MEPSIPHAQYIINNQGKKTAVLLSFKQYQKLIEDLHDLHIIAARREETPITLEAIKQKLRSHEQV